MAARAGQHDIGDRIRVHWQRLPVQTSPGPFTLVEAAVHQGSMSVLLEQELAAGDSAGGTKKRQCGNHGVVRAPLVGGCRQCQTSAVPAVGIANCGHPESARTGNLVPVSYTHL